MTTEEKILRKVELAEAKLCCIGETAKKIEANTAEIVLNTDEIEESLSEINSNTIAIYGAIDNLENLSEETKDILEEKLGTLINSVSDLQDSANGQTTNTSEILSNLQSVKTKLEESNNYVESIATEVGNIQPMRDLLENISLNLTSIEEQFSYLEKAEHEILEGVSKDYTQFKSLTFTVITGTTDITIEDSTITYPIEDTVIGNSFSADSKVTNVLTIDATNGKTLVTLIK